MTEPMDFDEILPYAGEFGLYQWVLFFAMAPFYANGVFLYFGQFFMSLAADFRCGNMPVNTCPNTTCEILEHNLSTIRDFNTIVTELDWICERGFYGPLAQSMFFVGAILGGIIFGWAADKYGRVPVLFATNFIGAVSTLLTASSNSLWEFIVYRFLAGLAFDNIFVMVYVLALEYVGPEQRTLVANLSIAIFYMAATVILPWLAVLVGDWRTLCTVTALPMAMSCACLWLMPESARWLISVGRVDEAIEVLKKIAKVNRKDIPDIVLTKFKNSQLPPIKADDNSEVLMRKSKRTEPKKEAELNEGEASSLLGAFKLPRLRKLFIIISVVWMIMSLVYDGHARNVSNLRLDVYITFTIASATEMPADLLLVFLLDRLGRRWMAFVTLGLAGFFSIITTAVDQENAIAVAVLAIIGRFCINVSFNIGLQYGAELLPTVIRAQGVAAIHIMGYVANLISPGIVYLGEINALLPLIILGVISAFGALLVLMLPETLGLDLPQTLKDGEIFGKGQKFFYFPWVHKPEMQPLKVEPSDESKRQTLARLRASRQSVRGETYRSSMIQQHRKQAIYVQADQKE